MKKILNKIMAKHQLRKEMKAEAKTQKDVFFSVGEMTASTSDSWNRKQKKIFKEIMEDVDA